MLATKPVLDGVPCVDVNTEYRLLGILLSNTKSVNIAYDLELSTEDFYRTKHKAIWSAICELYECKANINHASIKSIIEQNQNYAKYFSEESIEQFIEICAESCPLYEASDDVIANTIEVYIERLKELVYKRAIIRIGMKAKMDKTIEELRADIEKAESMLHYGHRTEHFSSARDLEKKEFTETQWIVPNILPKGLTLFCGKPKTGKSWLALGLAVSVASGGKAFGEIDMSDKQGKVLYLALEDNERRLKYRLSKLCAGNQFPAGLLYTTEIKRGTEGIKRIRNWLDTNDEAKLIVIDTLVSFRKQANKIVNEYDRDSNDMEMIQRLASDYSIGIILIHHLRKAIAEDEFDTISGTLGLTGKADTNLILKRVRGSSEAVLKGTGRDLEEDINIALKFDASIASWVIVSTNADEYNISKIQNEIYKLLEQKASGLSLAEISEMIGAKKENIRQVLYRMRERGIITLIDHRYFLRTL